MSAGLLLAIDQGTTSSKTVEFDESGNPVARASCPLKTVSPHPGWVEQDAEAIWQSVLQAVHDLPPAEGKIAGIGISNQRETVVLWERRSGKPLSPAIVWQCRRSESICRQLALQGAAARLRQKTGLSLDPLFSAGKICWLLDNLPGLRARAERGEVCCGTMDSWLIWNLTGGRVHACDRSNAARTQLMNLHTLSWDEELLALFRIPSAILPRIFDSCAVFGATVGGGPIPAGIPIASALGDSHAALAGHGIFAPGSVKATYGTGSSLMTLVSGEPGDSFPLSATVAWSRGGRTQYALEGNITMTGAAVDWCGQFLAMKGAGEFAALAAQVPDSGGITFVPAMCGLGAPYWESDARGAVIGLERASTPAHLARAALDSIAFQVADVYQSMSSKAGDLGTELHAGGGGARNDLLMQIQADVLGNRIVRPAVLEMSATGAALMAGLTLGLWQEPGEMGAIRAPRSSFSPSAASGAVQADYQRWKAAVWAVMEHTRAVRRLRSAQDGNPVVLSA